jgi:nitrate reductase gamma subunit
LDWLVTARLSLFWKTMAIAAVPILLAVGRWLWLLSRGHDGSPGASAGGRGLLAALARGPEMGWHRFGRGLLVDGVLHPSLWQRSRARWLGHAGMLLGFLGLMSLSAVAAFADHVLRPLNLAPALVAVILNKDHPLMALPNESFGLLLLLGGLAASWRRFSPGHGHMARERTDTVAIALLIGITVSGYPLEALRLLAESVPPEAARYSFVGWPLARLLGPLALPWAQWHFWGFQAHILASIVLFIYWPLGKMMHVLAGAAVAALNTSGTRVTR